MSLPDKIRYDSIVQSFTRPTPEDIQAPPPIGLIKAVAPTRPTPPSKPTTSKYVKQNLLTLVVDRDVFFTLGVWDKHVCVLSYRVW